MKMSKILGIYDMFQPNFISTSSSRLLCGHIPDLCKFGGLFTDEKLDISDIKRVGVFFSHFPSGTSIRSMEHFS